MKKKGIIAVLAIAMTSAIASMATGCKLVDNIKQKIEQAKCEHATEVVTEIKPATCTESGLTEGVKCGDCDKWIVEPDEIPALGHELVKDEAVPATCLKSGLTEGSHCSRCEETIKAQEKTKATGHKLVAVEAKEATCTEAGNTAGLKCETCGVVYQGCEEVSALGHNYLDGVCESCSYVVTVTSLSVGQSVSGLSLKGNYNCSDEDELCADYTSEYVAIGREMFNLYEANEWDGTKLLASWSFSDGTVLTISFEVEDDWKVVSTFGITNSSVDYSKLTINFAYYSGEDERVSYAYYFEWDEYTFGENVTVTNIANADIDEALWGYFEDCASLFVKVS